MPNDLAAKNEKGFQAALFHVFTLVGANICTEVATATGRIDVVIDTQKTVYLLELKLRHKGAAHPSAEGAMGQIDKKKCALPYSETGNHVVRVGVAFSEQERTIDTDWVIRRE